MLLWEMAIFTLVVLCPGIGDCRRQACVNAISFHVYHKAGLLYELKLKPYIFVTSNKVNVNKLKYMEAHFHHWIKKNFIKK